MATITIKAHDKNEQFSAYVKRPKGVENPPAIVVIQEIFGVNKVMRDICDDLAKQGYLAICPDLFWRQERNVDITDKTQGEWDKAFSLFNGFNVDLGIEDLKSTLKHIRTFENFNGKIGTIGFCLGGKLAYLMATRSDADCNISYYGVGLDALLSEKDKIHKPLLMHMAELDKFVPPAAQEKITTALKGHPYIELHLYKGVDHAFARVGGEHYDEASAKLANKRTADFMKSHLS